MQLVERGTAIAERTGKRLKDLNEAAEALSLPVGAVEALVNAGYLIPAHDDPISGMAFAPSDLKGFVARNVDGALEAGLPEIIEGGADPDSLLDAVNARADDMARRALDVFAAAVPEAVLWTDEERARFVDQSTKRFEAILGVIGAGDSVDGSLIDDLEDVGASAAWSGSPLPQLLVVLRISRDLVVQTAVEVAEERGRRWGLALSLLLTRVLPALDRLTDALAQGYWAAVVGREEESRARYEHLVERSSDGIYELDVTGRVSYANGSLAAIVGQPVLDLVGARIDELFDVVGGAEVLDRLSGIGDGEADETFEVRRGDGVRRELHVVSFPRHHDGEVVGYQGVVRDVTAARDAERAKRNFLDMVTGDLRSPVTTILGLGVTLEAYADELPTERIRRIGGSIRRQAERVSRLADNLYEVSRLESQSLRLNLRSVDVAPTVEAALASLPDPDAVELRIPSDLVVLADARRLEQVVANLVENALSHGAPPVVVAGRMTGAGVVLDVSDAGPGLPEELVGGLFSGAVAADSARVGLGLFLVRGLVEAMGGRVSYESPAGGGSVFRVHLVRPPRR